MGVGPRDGTELEMREGPKFLFKTEVSDMEIRYRESRFHWNQCKCPRT